MTKELQYTKGNEKDWFYWAVTGPYGGVHIWCRVQDDSGSFYGGIECHWRDHENPDHEHCWLLNGPCRHDGSSLYFSENIAPLITLEDIESEALENYLNNILTIWYKHQLNGWRTFS